MLSVDPPPLMLIHLHYNIVAYFFVDTVYLGNQQQPEILHLIVNRCVIESSLLLIMGC